MAADPRRSAVSATMLAQAGGTLSRELLEATLDLLPFPVVLVEPGSARIVSANRAADDLAGGDFPRAAGAGEYTDLYVCTDAGGRVLDNDRMPGVRAARGERLDGELLDWHLPGGVRSLHVSSAPVPAAGDRAELVLIAFEDVTPMVRAEARARDAGALLDTFFESAPVGLALLDRDLRFQRVNAALAGMDGIAVDAHVGRQVLDVLPGSDPAVAERLREVLATGVPFEAEVGASPDARPGERRHWLAGFYPVRQGREEVTGLGATFTDISERVEAERRSAFLADAGEVLGRSLDLETTLRDVASIAVPERADWCVIDLLEQGAIRRVAVAHADPAKERLGWEMSERWPPALDTEGPLAYVLRGGAPVLIGEVDDAMLAAAARDDRHLEILRELGFRGGVVAPLRARDRVLGAITFMFAGSGRQPDRIDLELATELARRAASAIDNARLYRERSHIARTLQRSLLPPRLPHVEGFEIAARYRAAGEGNDVGGDFYDLFACSDSRWIVVLGDVCGKGPEAAALTALARYTLRAAAVADGDPVALLTTLNDTLVRDHDGPGASDRFMTAVAGLLRLDAGDPVLKLGAAGHPPAVLVRAGGASEVLRLGGRAVGLLPGVDIGEAQVTLHRGDALVLYTDGVLDAGAPARPLALDDLVTAVTEMAGQPPARMAEAVERAALACADGAPRDDIAIVVLRRAGA